MANSTNVPTPNVPNPKAAGGQVSFRVVLNAIRRYPFAFVMVLVTTALVFGGVWVFLPMPKYTAAVVYQFDRQGPRVISQTMENSVDVGSYGKRQSVSVKKRLILNKVLDDADVKKVSIISQDSNPIRWLETKLQVDFKGGADYMRVYMEGDQPDEMLAILKALSKAYLADIETENNTQRNEKLQALDTQLILKQGEIKAKQNRIDVIAKQLKTTDSITLAHIDAINHDELRGVRKELLEIQAKIEYARSELIPDDAPVPPVPVQLIDEAVRKDQAVMAAEAKVVASKQNLTEVESRFEKGTMNPFVVKARNDVTSSVEKRDATILDRRGQLMDLVTKQYAEDLKNEANKKKEIYNQLERHKVVVDAQYQEIIAKINKHGEYRVELDNLRNDISSQQKLITAMSEEKERIRVESSAPNRVKTYEEPFVVEGLEGNRRLKYSSMASGAFFLIGFAILVRWEHRARRVNSADELVNILGIPLLGTLPPLATKNSLAQGELVEAIDSTRTLMLHCRNADNPLRTVMISSALPGEGKTTLSGHLAISLARAGYRTMLVDGDLHRHSISTLFEKDDVNGFCEVLRGETSLAEVICTTDVPRLSLIPAGIWSLVARQALVADKWVDIRRQLEKDFDFIVLDTGPFLLLADAQLLARNVDGVILSSLLRTSRFGAVVQTRDRLLALGARLLGAVVQGVTTSHSGGYYSGYRYYRYYRSANPASIGKDTVELEKVGS